MRWTGGLAALLTLSLAAGCATTPAPAPRPAAETAPEPGETTRSGDPYPSTYQPLPSRPTLDPQRHRPHRGRAARSTAARCCCATARSPRSGATVAAPAGAVVVDAAGKWVTPGVIDAHSHLGRLRLARACDAHGDGNEATAPMTAEVWAEHSVWPQDPQFPLALAGGVTTHADPARLGQPDRRPQRDAQERARRAPSRR